MAHYVKTKIERLIEYIDLGLSVKWASSNVGAKNPEEYGDYLSFDEAQKLKVKVPTIEQWGELISKCKWEWQGNGYKVIANNGNSIFLPAAGYRVGSSLYYAGSFGYYWSSFLGADYSVGDRYVYFNSEGVYRIGNDRFGGLSIRAVSE